MTFISKRMQGLSLVEAMLAILVVGISLTALLSLQGVLSRNVFGLHALIDRMPYIKNMFVQADRDKLYTKQGIQEKKIEDPPTTLHYSTSKPSDGQKFKAYPNIMIEKVEAVWSSLRGTSRQTQIMFRFYPKGSSA